MRTDKALLGASLILAIAIVAGAFLVKTSLDSGANELKGALAEIQTAVGVAGAGAQGAARRGAAARRRPDPALRHKVDTASAPTRGPKGARVTLVEFSDFQ